MSRLLYKVYRRLIKKLNVYYYKWLYRIKRQNVVWGENVKISGRLIIEGPGEVHFGDNVFIDGSGQPVTPFTHSKSAKIIIGSNSFLNGSRFGCVERIEVGENCLIAECNIIDTDFHPVDPEARLRDEPGNSGAVFIGKNVWVAGGAFVLCDTKIGSDSTVGALSVVKGQFKQRSLIAGNPAKVVRKL